MRPQKQTLYSVPWQALRVSLLGKWTSSTGTAENIQTLKTYLAKSTKREKLSRLWRVLNALNAVRMGNSGQGAADSERDVLVRDFRDDVSAQYAEEKKTGEFVIDSEETIRRDWAALSDATRRAIRTNLKKRQELHRNSPHRTELAEFLRIIA